MKLKIVAENKMGEYAQDSDCAVFLDGRNIGDYLHGFSLACEIGEPVRATIVFYPDSVEFVGNPETEVTEAM